MINIVITIQDVGSPQAALLASMHKCDPTESEWSTFSVLDKHVRGCLEELQHKVAHEYDVYVLVKDVLPTDTRQS